MKVRTEVAKTILEYLGGVADTDKPWKFTREIHLALQNLENYDDDPSKQLKSLEKGYYIEGERVSNTSKHNFELAGWQWKITKVGREYLSRLNNIKRDRQLKKS